MRTGVTTRIQASGAESDNQCYVNLQTLARGLAWPDLASWNSQSARTARALGAIALAVGRLLYAAQLAARRPRCATATHTEPLAERRRRPRSQARARGDPERHAARPIDARGSGRLSRAASAPMPDPGHRLRPTQRPLQPAGRAAWLTAWPRGRLQSWSPAGATEPPEPGVSGVSELFEDSFERRDNLAPLDLALGETHTEAERLVLRAKPKRKGLGSARLRFLGLAADLFARGATLTGNLFDQAPSFSAGFLA